ncbi:MAG TPA: hypothetical protein VE732_03330 [Nitrososphaera sp.]|jgi:uncharacterized protein YutE (UPF0331/DUF86 family)|nr:hypothetical protein [Nitrososphaera sp.]
MEGNDKHSSDQHLSQNQSHVEVPSEEDMPLPDCVTDSGRYYFDSAFRLINLFYFIIDRTLTSDFVAFVAREALDGKTLPENSTPSELAKTNPGPSTRFLRRNSQALLEMTLCRIVDNFETYLSEVIRESLHSRPEMLRSKEQIRVDYALQFGSVEELTADIIDRKVSDLGYLGFNNLDAWCNEKMGINVLIDEGQRDSIVEIIETRNAIVHNRGIVGAKYLKNVNNPPFKKGDARELEVDYLFNAFSNLCSCVKSFDERVAVKFSIPTSKYNQSKEDFDIAEGGEHK